MGMRVFVTGATGYLGSAIAIRLARAGHDVRGLGRNEDRAAVLGAARVTPLLGDLAQPESYLAELKNSDAVVHAAFDATAPSQQDQRALETIRAAAQDGRVRRLLYTSGVWVYGDTGGRVVDETAPLDPAELVAWRPAHEEVALSLAAHEVEVAVFRPGVVYGETRGVLGAWFREAKEKGTVTIPGNGLQHWSMVHRDDVADAYLLGLEHAGGGERYVLTDETRLTVRELADAVARATGARVRARARDEVLKAKGAYGAALLMDQQFTSAKARRKLGWVPSHTSFVAEAEALHSEWLAGRKTKVG